jgi:hypothetical protein
LAPAPAVVRRREHVVSINLGAEQRAALGVP